MKLRVESGESQNEFGVEKRRKSETQNELTVKNGER